MTSWARKHGNPKSLEWTEDVSPAGNFPYFIWNGQIVRPELAASHTLKNEAFHGPPLWKIALLYKMDRWMSLQQGFTHTLSEMDRWIYLSWQLPILQKMKDFYVFSSGNEEGGLCPKNP